MKFKQAVANGIIVLVSVTIGLFLFEAGLRLLLNPADYLAVKMVRDEVLGITIAPNSAGFDEWGFRNRGVPSAADVVAIGDSHTYGNTAAMDDSWPSVLARGTGLGVYNLGLGGYGPNQYYHLLTTRALKLHPRWVLCGLYMGDDFENAFAMTYGMNHWSPLRNGRWDDVDADIWGAPQPAGWNGRIRNWLSQNSIIYRLVVHGAPLTKVKENVQFWQVSRNSDPFTTSLIVDDKNIREAFRPISIANRLDQMSGPVREGMRITFHLLKEMNSVCRQEGCKFLVVIIPTKEMVFADYLENNSRLHLYEALDRLITNERSARKELVEFLDSTGIAYLDTLPAMKQSVGDELYARTTRDMHPSKNGYRVIGEAVAGYLRLSGSLP